MHFFREEACLLRRGVLYWEMAPVDTDLFSTNGLVAEELLEMLVQVLLCRATDVKSEQLAPQSL